jgi:Fur family ferric uptake transcriptional regulator
MSINSVGSQRNTRQKDAVAKALANAPGPLTPPEILKLAKKAAPGIGIATVYRALGRMVESGEATLVQIGDLPPRYEKAQGHHHHFYCRKCRKVFELHACDGAANKLAPRGFKVDAHEITLFGRCAECA